MAKVPGNDGLDWGLFPTKADFPNEPGSAIQSADLVVGARAYAADSGPYVCAVPTVGAATWVTAGTGTDAADIPYTPTTPGDWPNPDPTDVQEALDDLAERVTDLVETAATVGPFTCTTAVGPVGAYYGGVTGLGWVAPRTGSIVSISGNLSGTASDDNITYTCVVNAAPIALTGTFTAGADVTDYATASAGTYAIAAGDVVFMAATGGAGLTNTPTFAGSFEFLAS